jgi:hypothetical protein
MFTSPVNLLLLDELNCNVALDNGKSMRIKIIYNISHILCNL